MNQLPIDTVDDFFSSQSSSFVVDQALVFYAKTWEMEGMRGLKLQYIAPQSPVNQANEVGYPVSTCAGDFELFSRIPLNRLPGFFTLHLQQLIDGRGNPKLRVVNIVPHESGRASILPSVEFSQLTGELQKLRALNLTQSKQPNSSQAKQRSAS